MSSDFVLLSTSLTKNSRLSSSKGDGENWSKFKNNNYNHFQLTLYHSKKRFGKPWGRRWRWILWQRLSCRGTRTPEWSWAGPRSGGGSTQEGPTPPPGTPAQNRQSRPHQALAGSSCSRRPCEETLSSSTAKSVHTLCADPNTFWVLEPLFLRHSPSSPEYSDTAPSPAHLRSGTLIARGL